MSKIPIFNKKDEIIEIKEHKEIKKSDIYRVSALWITNSKNQILLAKRAKTKRQHPNKWGPAVAGTIEEGETYKSNIIKEANEELGLKNIKPKKGIKQEVIGDYHHFTQWFFIKLDKPLNYFKPNKKEVQKIKWFSEPELLEKTEKNSDDILKSMKDFIKQKLSKK